MIGFQVKTLCIPCTSSAAQKGLNSFVRLENLVVQITWMVIYISIQGTKTLGWNKNGGIYRLVC
jgi:hypothetical protein